MPECCYDQQKAIASGRNRGAFFSILMVCLFLGLLVLYPGNAPAKVYVWKDAGGKIHLTDRPPPRQHSIQKSVTQTIPEKEQADHAAVNENVQHVIDTVETAFRNTDIDLLLQVYTVPGGAPDEAEERIAEEAVTLSLEKFFTAFGVPGKFTPIPENEFPQQFLQEDYIPRGCTPSFQGFSFPLSKNNATGLVFLTICETGQQARLISFNYDLKNPTPEQQKEFTAITSETLKQVAAQLQQQSDPKVKAPKATTPEKQSASKPASAPEKVQPPKALPGAKNSVPAASNSFPKGQSGLPGANQQQGAVSLPGANFAHGMDPFAITQMVSMFTGTAMMIQVAVSLVFYFVTSLCLYLIARKTNTRGAWLAWVPLLQIFPMIQSAGIAWWWGLVVYFAPIPLFFIPLLGIIVMVLWLVALLVFFAIVWMRISERLGMNKWLGLVIFVPMFNVVIMALLAFNGESKGADIALKSIVGRTVLAYVLATLVLCSVLYLYVMPLMQDLISQTAAMQKLATQGVAKSMTGIVQNPAVSGTQHKRQQPSQDTPKKQAGPEVSLDTAYYEKLFKQKAPGFSDDTFEKGRPESCVGPACVLLSNFWDQQDPHVWLKVRIPDVPYMTLFDSSNLVISDVLNSSGKNVYNSKSSFETEHFLDLRFTQHSGGYLEAIRDVHLLAGTKEADLKTVQGELQFKFPLHVESADFVSKDAGQAKNIAGLQVTLQELGGNSAKIQIVGDIDRYIGVKAYDASGTELEAGGSSSMTSENTKSSSYSFQGDISVFRVFAAKKLLSKSYAFTLQVK